MPHSLSRRPDRSWGARATTTSVSDDHGGSEVSTRRIVLGEMMGHARGQDAPRPDARLESIGLERNDGMAGRLGEHASGRSPEDDLAAVDREADRQDGGERVHADGHPSDVLPREQPNALGRGQHLGVGTIERHLHDDHPWLEGFGRGEGPFLSGVARGRRGRARRGEADMGTFGPGRPAVPA